MTNGTDISSQRTRVGEEIGGTHTHAITENDNEQESKCPPSTAAIS
ncbi:hypothetical protein AG1IA_02132 [Rhizoctonia solani AG-1 IA]|uniref:Uncharacterized protein n=1 Tax=Thanatephorus cucumeris (strain AG1-IA) TaxID=983506 RepID=L8X5E3_THACA|nr:hypothetical protein AG1IA_02132 [Rhizoctonia solani AG-1 IA]